MEWEIKVQLVKALNTGNNKEACEIILKNEMDMQAVCLGHGFKKMRGL